MLELVGLGVQPVAHLAHPGAMSYAEASGDEAAVQSRTSRMMSIGRPAPSSVRIISNRDRPLWIRIVRFRLVVRSRCVLATIDPRSPR